MSKNELKLLYLFIALVLFGCSQKNKSTFLSVPDALKKACLFQKDSYWIYRNDSTGITDCTYVKTNPISNNTTYGLNYIVDYIQTPLGGSLFDQFYISGRPTDGYRFYANYYNTTPCEGLPAYVIFNDSLNNHKGSDGCSSGSGKYTHYEWNSFMQLGVIPGFTVSGLRFDIVGITRTKFYSEYASGNLPEDDSIDFYYSPGNGLVKIILRIDTANSYTPMRATISWSLLRYHVVK